MFQALTPTLHWLMYIAIAGFVVGCTGFGAFGLAVLFRATEKDDGQPPA